jgi:hypothetical protein
MLKFEYFVYGRSANEDDVLIMGRSFSQKDFYEELYKHSRAMQDPKATIFTVDESIFNRLKTVDRIKVI